MNKKRITIIALIMGCLLMMPLQSYGQEKKLKVSLQSGYSDPGKGYKNLDKGYNAALDVSYYVYKNLFITLHYKLEEGSYYEDRPILTDAPNNSIRGNTNTNLFVDNLGLMVGYSYPVIPRLSISAQTGMTFFKEILTNIPYRRADGNISAKDKAMLSAAIPLKLSVDYKVLDFMAIGVASGFYIQPDFNDAIRGFYVGPQISFLF
jgi:hypothetical protein